MTELNLDIANQKLLTHRAKIFKRKKAQNQPETALLREEGFIIRNSKHHSPTTDVCGDKNQGKDGKGSDTLSWQDEFLQDFGDDWQVLF